MSMNQRYIILVSHNFEYITQIQFFTTSQMSFSLRFNVWLRWIDKRLGYQNLNEDHYQNVVTEKTATNIWKPLLVFDNSMPQQVLHSKYDPASSDMLVMRHGESKEAPLSQWNEAKVYNSSETEILWRTVHLLKFTCQFHLHYFPFDHQTCFVQVRSLTIC